MSCSINDELKEYSINEHHVNELLAFLEEEVECAGKIIIDTNKGHSTYITSSKSNDLKNVYAPDSLVNWHSHPFLCYTTENVVWGWPSGDDMRETIVQGLRGTLCHVLPTVEGIYIMQPNPCVLNNLINLPSIEKPSAFSSIKNWNGFIRGLFIGFVEVYFKATHMYRSIDYLKKYNDATADDFVTFANNFNISKMLTDMGKCENTLKCGSIIVFENGIKKQISFEEYATEYFSETDIDQFINYYDDNGGFTTGDITYEYAIKNGAFEILKKVLQDCSIKNFGKDRLFNIELYRNSVYFNKWVVYSNLSIDDKWKYLNSIDRKIKLHDKKIKFSIFDLKGFCNHKHIRRYIKSRSLKRKRSKNKIIKLNKLESKNKHSLRSRRSFKRSNLPVVILMGSSKCGYCVEADQIVKKLNKDNKIKYTFKDYPSVSKAIAEIKKINSEISKIPAFFINGKYIEKHACFSFIKKL